MRWLPVLLALLTASPAVAANWSQPGSGLVVDEIVAIVDLSRPRVILLSELVVLARLNRARAGNVQALKEPVDGATLRATLDKYIDELVILDEAAKLQLPDISKPQLEAAIAAIRASVGPAAYDTFSAEYDLDDDVLDLVRREIRMRSYLTERLGAKARPRESDVQQYVEAHPEMYSGVDPAAAVSDARVRLTQERFSELSTAFVADLRRRARIRILHDPSLPGGPTPLAGAVSCPPGSKSAGDCVAGPTEP